MSFEALEGDWYIDLPVRGKTYRVESPPAEIGAWVHSLFFAAKQHVAAKNNGQPVPRRAQETLSDDEERELYPELLGATYDEMLADEVPWVAVQHVGATVMIWVASGTAAAETYWKQMAPGSSPEAPAPNRATRRAAAKKTAASSGSGSRTPSPASTAGTTRRKAPARS